MKPRPNVPTAKRADRERLAPRREPLPAAERLLLLASSAARRGASCAARRPPAARGRGRRRSRWILRHRTQCIACFGVAYTRSSTSPTSTSAARDDGAIEQALAGARRAVRAASCRRQRRPDAPRPAAPARARRGLPARARPARARGPGQPRHPVHLPRPLHAPVARVRAPVGDDRARLTAPTSCIVVGLNSVRPWRHQSGGIRDGAARADGASCSPRRRTGALRVVALHHHLIGAPWRSRKRPVARRSHVLARARRRAAPS